MSMDKECGVHQDHPEERSVSRCETCKRLRLEREIVRRTAKVLVETGHNISVFDSEAFPVMRSTSVEEIMRNVMTTDEDRFVVRGGGLPENMASFVQFIYGNDGWDVISDYGVSLKEILQPVFAYAEKHEQ